MSQVSNVSSTASSTEILGSGSLQLMFAKLQLALAETAKKGALQQMDEIQKAQEEQKLVAGLLNEARQAQANAGKDGTAPMSPELKAYMDANGLAYDKSRENAINGEIAGNQAKIDANNAKIAQLENKKPQWLYKSTINSLKKSNAKLTDKNDQLKKELATPPSFTKDEWEIAITSLKAHQDQLATDTQQKMVFVQDFMGQYNSYLTGANSAIQQSNQTLADLARLR